MKFQNDGIGGMAFPIFSFSLHFDDLNKMLDSVQKPEVKLILSKLEYELI